MYSQHSIASDLIVRKEAYSLTIKSLGLFSDEINSEIRSLQHKTGICLPDTKGMSIFYGSLQWFDLQWVLEKCLLLLR